jgi:hypothetical protein
VRMPLGHAGSLLRHPEGMDGAASVDQMSFSRCTY